MKALTVTLIVLASFLVGCTVVPTVRESAAPQAQTTNQPAISNQTP